MVKIYNAWFGYRECESKFNSSKIFSFQHLASYFHIFCVPNLTKFLIILFSSLFSPLSVRISSAKKPKEKNSLYLHTNRNLFKQKLPSESKRHSQGMRRTDGPVKPKDKID